MTALVDQVTAAAFRSAMAALPAPITVITYLDRTGAPRGLTVSAVTSLSLAPPLLLACLDRNSSNHDPLTDSGSFCVNLLAPGDEALARRFAGPSAQRFTGVELVAGRSGVALRASDLRIHCDRDGLHDGGDHTILIGRVTRVDGDGPAGLIWHRRGFAHATPAR